MKFSMWFFFLLSVMMLWMSMEMLLFGTPVGMFLGSYLILASMMTYRASFYYRNKYRVHRKHMRLWDGVTITKHEFPMYELPENPTIRLSGEPKGIKFLRKCDD